MLESINYYNQFMVNFKSDTTSFVYTYTSEKARVIRCILTIKFTTMKMKLPNNKLTWIYLNVL